jgi:hypothetical protein
MWRVQWGYKKCIEDTEDPLAIQRIHRRYRGSIGDTEDPLAIHRIQRIRWRYGDTEDPFAIRGYTQSRDPAIRFFPLAKSSSDRTKPDFAGFLPVWPQKWTGRISTGPDQRNFESGRTRPESKNPSGSNSDLISGQLSSFPKNLSIITFRALNNCHQLKKSMCNNFCNCEQLLNSPTLL